MDEDTRSTEKENLQENIKHQSCALDHGGLSEHVPPGPSPCLLSSLQSLVEDNDHTLLPHSLHQIAEAYVLEEDYQWAVEFLSLEKMYHERLLSNLASIQEQWESQWKTSSQTRRNSSNTSVSERERAHIESLSHICRTHLRPKPHAEKNTSDVKLHNSPAHVTEHRVSEPQQDLVEPTAEKKQAGDAGHQPEDCELNEEGQEEDLDEDEFWNEELEEETDADGQDPQEELTKLIQIEEMFPTNGLVSILKKRVCATESLQPQKKSNKRKVRFRDPDEVLDQDESPRGSCLVLLLLCLLTVGVSLGWTAVYCLVGGSSDACVDFFRNLDFYVGIVRRGLDVLVACFGSITTDTLSCFK